MKEELPQPADAISAQDQLSACHTMTGLAVPNDQLAIRLQHVADLLLNSPILPAQPILVWRALDHSVHYAMIGEGFVVGRQEGAADLSFPGDTLLSRTHFVIRPEGNEWVLRDLDSRNGTWVNRTDEKVHRRPLRDGDLIIAGNLVFAFLDQRMTH